MRQAEALVAALQQRESRPQSKGENRDERSKDPHLASMEDKLRERFGTKIHLRYAQGKGALQISFFSDAELERILQILGVGEPE